MSTFKFIDLFSGIGGFHQAMQSLGGECVFASDIDAKAAETYRNNYGMESLCDITKVKAEDIPAHDVLCAGFPCQAFSTAGHKKGFSDTRGTLFFEIERILKYHNTKFIVLENVKHLLTHDGGNTYKVIHNKLEELGYVMTEKPIVLSPHYFGVPQNRERLYILGIKKDYLKDDIKYLDIELPDIKNCPKTSIYDILDKSIKNEEKYHISDYEERILNAWDVFHKTIKQKVFGFPIWVDEFGKDYDYSAFPKWKQDYVVKNRKLYNENKKFIDKWLKNYDVLNFKLRDRKFEWQAGENYESVWDTSIQLRQSGIRCKKTDYFPTLVAMVQTPIVGKLKRRITPKEASRLQSFPESFVINDSDQIAYKQFGNSVNVKILIYLTQQLFKNVK